MSYKIIVAVVLVAAAAASPDQAPAPVYGAPPPAPPPAPAPAYGAPPPPPPPEAPAKYSFSWKVKDDASGNDFGHDETRDGPHTEGVYYVLLPDGRVQKVVYTVDGEGGYVPVVTYEGEAKPPTPVYTPPPVYG
nr:pro-resilin-like [Procambarus clarkii]